METNIPQSDESERAVLGAILVEPNNYAEIEAILAPKDFYSSVHGLIFASMALCVDSGDPIDLLTICNHINVKKLPGGVVYLSQLMDGIPKLSNAAFYAKIVKEKSALRAQLKSTNQILHYINEGGKDPNYAIQVLQEFKDAVVQPETETRSMKSVLNGMLEVAHQRQEGESVGEFYSTGSKIIDQFFRYEKGKLYVVGGRPAMGKTAWALQQATNLCLQGLSGLMFEQEMPAEEIATRMASSLSRVPFSRVRDVSPDAPLPQEEWDRLGTSYAQVEEDIDLQINDRPGRSIFDVEAEIIRENNVREANDLKPLSFLIFDYIQIADLGPSNDRVKAIGRFTSKLKELAREHNLVVIALSQLSRPAKDAYDKQGVPRLPQNSDLRDSGAIEQDADCVIFIHRPEYYLATGGHEVGHWASVAQISVAKNRGGGIGCKKLGWVGELMVFSDPWFEVEGSDND